MSRSTEQVKQQWSSPESKKLNEQGVRAVVGEQSPYQRWHRSKLPSYCYAHDLDNVEWRKINGVMRRVAVIEITFSAQNYIHENYCTAALARFKDRDAQYAMVTDCARALGVPAYFVVAFANLQEFWVCNLAEESWTRMTEPEYIQWMVRLRPPATH
jgi:hypothetical protein